MHPISKQAFRPLHKQNNIWISTPALLLPYAGVFLLIFLAETSQNWFARFAVLPLIAALQMHLQILQHEGAHYLLCRSRKWNDRLAETLCSIPFLNLLRHYRFFHLQHHRFLLDPKLDPEVDFYREQLFTFERKSPKAIAKMLFLDFCGYHYFQFFFSYNRYLVKETRAGRMPPLSKQEWLLCALITMLFILLAIKFGFELIFYWFLPQATILFFFLKLHGYGEHSKRSHTIEESTYAHQLNPFIKFFLYPFNSDYHLEHHLDPSIPWFKLRAQRQLLPPPLMCRNYFFGEHSVFKTILSRKDFCK